MARTAIRKRSGEFRPLSERTIKPTEDKKKTDEIKKAHCGHRGGKQTGIYCIIRKEERMVQLRESRTQIQGPTTRAFHRFNNGTQSITVYLSLKWGHLQVLTSRLSHEGICKKIPSARAH
jgi:hypothetical protein